jgi:soluble lytic murein transglycosylase
MQHGDYAKAAESYSALLTRPLDSEEDAEIRLGLGTAYLRDKAYAGAAHIFRALRDDHPGSGPAHEAAFLLGDALVGAGEPLSATLAYSAYLQAGTAITPYVDLALGDAYREAGHYAAAVNAYERSIATAPHPSFEAGSREQLALVHIALDDYISAAEQYGAILTFAQVPAYRARVEHQQAEALLLAGEIEAGLERHLAVVEAYPTEGYAYLSLIELVAADRSVGSLLRGKVDYYGGAYGPAVTALYQYIADYPESHSGDAHWYAGLSFLATGSTALAANEFQLLIDTHPANRFRGDAWLKLAGIQADQGRVQDAVETYRAFAEAAPDHHLAPQALWEAAQLLERNERTEAAAAAFLDCQAVFPSADVAAPSLFRGGLLLHQLDQVSAASSAWETLVEDYPDSAYQPAALLWLGKLHLAGGEREAAQAAWERAHATDPEAYYGLRAAQLAAAPSGWPFPIIDDRAPGLGTNDGLAGSRDRREAEQWLASWLDLDSVDAGLEPAPGLIAGGRLQRGRELWRLGRFLEAKTELEALQRGTVSDALSQYQLALEYSDMGLFRSSILCAGRVIALSPLTRTLDAPSFILKLAYPSAYGDLVLQEAERTGLDPLLILSLIRQESLFESLATSSASAQGLMQVIPPTGAQIAAELDWPPGYATADLYRPYVSLRFGTYYLATQRDRFDSRIDVALAAYNGGPSNAQRWLERAGDDPDRFLEEITFSETRLYLQRIVEHFAVYQVLYGE